MRNLGFVACALALVLNMAIDVGKAFGQGYPNRPIRILAPGPGASSDYAARLIAPGMFDVLGQRLIVDNRPVMLTEEIVAKATPDGYTLLVQGSSFWVRPLLAKVPYDVTGDFAPISLIGTQPNVLLVTPSLPAKSVSELIALAKAKPGELNYVSTAIGGSAYMAAELFKAMAGVNFVRVGYAETSQGTLDMIAGRVHLIFASAPSAAPHIKSGKLRALAVSSEKPSALFPALPTIAASGVPGYVAGNATAMFAPKKTPEGVIKGINHAVVQVLNKPDVKEKFLANSVDVVGSSPEQLATLIKFETARLGKLIKDAGIKPE